MVTPEFRSDDVRAVRHELDRIKSRLDEMARANPARSTAVTDADGKVVFRTNTDGQAFYDGDEQLVAELGRDGISLYDLMGTILVRLSSGGLVVDEGAIEVGGGPVRAMDIAFAEGQSSNLSLTSTMQEGGVITVTPPAWATTVVAQVFCLFQMTNSSGAEQRILFRSTVNGVPSSGAYTHSVTSGEVGNVSDVFQLTLERGTDFVTDFAVAGVMGVQTGTNGANVVRTKVTLYYLR